MIARAKPRLRIAQARFGCLGIALLALLIAMLPVAVRAQTPPPGNPPSAQAPSAAELERLVDTLQDDKARAALVAQLQSLIAAQRGAEPAPPASRDPLQELSQRVHEVSGEILAGVAVLVDAPMLYGWGYRQIADAATRARWIAVGLALGIIFGFGLVAEWVVRRVFARLVPRSWTPGLRRHPLVQLLLVALDLIVEVFPVGVFAAVAALAAPLTLPPFSMALYGTLELVEATILARLVIAATQALLVPAYLDSSGVPASEETRNYLLIWIKRFTCWTVFGYAAAAAGWWLGVPGGVYALMLKIVALVLAILAIVFLLQNRAAVGGWIAGERSGPAGWRRVRRRLAEIWYILAVAYIAGLYLVYALHVEGGSAFVLRATLLSLVVIVGARLLVRSGERLSGHGLAVAPDLRLRFPQLEARANRYLPIVIGLFRIALYALAALLVLQAWDVGSFAWFQSATGRRIGGAALAIAVVIAIALVGWELTAAAIERHLAALEANGAPGRDRRRTLLPLLRTAVLGVIVVVAGLIILSQIGIDIAPLLAGAGIVGLAVGFGSQALVKDIITGLFMLVEDQIAIGDIVDVGKDHKGVVEAISIRTIRLRDQSGAVVTVPFGEVTTVKNSSRDFTYVVARITVANSEDIDRVVEILRGVCDELAADKTLGSLILDPFDYQGVDSLDDFSVALLLRVRTVPGKHFVVGRALNRLVKIAFDKHGIAGRDPSPVMITTAPAAAGLPGDAAEGAASRPRQRRTA